MTKLRVVVRLCERYSCRKRGERAKVAAKAELDVSEEVTEVSSSNWAQCIKRVYEINPLECPRCKGEMRIVAFVQDGPPKGVPRRLKFFQ